MFFILLLTSFTLAASFASRCPFKDNVACMQWRFEVRMSKLENQVAASSFGIRMSKQDVKLAELTKSNFDITTELKVARNMLDMCLAKNNSNMALSAKVAGLTEELTKTKAKVAELKAHSAQEKTKLTSLTAKVKKGWQLIRKVMIFPSLKKIPYKNGKTYNEALPSSLPDDTKAVIISVYCSFLNSKGHAYLWGEMNQKGNSGKVKLENYHYNVHANTWYNELFLPWNTTLSNVLEVKVTESRLDGGSSNWYRIQLEGYVTA